MSGDGPASLTSRTFSAVRQLAEINPDHIVLQKDTYLIDECNRIIPIPAGTVAILEQDAEQTAVAAVSDAATTDVQADTEAVVLSSSETSIQATNMPADSTSMGNTSPMMTTSHSSTSAVSAACEVVEATSSDPNPSLSLTDMFVQEEEEVTDELKDQEAVVSASGTVEDSNQSQSKDVGRKRGRKTSQRKTRKVSDEGKVDSGTPEAKWQKCSVPVPAENPSPMSENSPASNTSSSTAMSSISASGRPQRSTPRRSAYELLHGGESKPQRRSSTPAAESEQEGSSAKSHRTKKQKVSKSGTASEEGHKELEETKVDAEQGTAQKKAQRPRKPSAQTASQTPVSSDGCEGPSSCTISNNISSATVDESKNSPLLSPSCPPATDGSNVVQSTSSEVVNNAEEMEVEVSKPQNKSMEPGDDVHKMSGKKQNKSKKAALSKHDDSHPSDTAAGEKGNCKKKVVGKQDLASKSAKMKGSKKPRVTGSDEKMDDVDYMKVPGMPYNYFTADSDNHLPSDEDADSSLSLRDALASDDVDWMSRRIVELEQQVRRLQDVSAPQDGKQTSRCWQDVLTEVADLPSEDVDEKLMLSRYERKLRALDRELDDRASFLRVREGCIARRERRILEKEGELGKRERELEHQRHLHGRVKLASKSPPSDTTAISIDFANSSMAASNRKQALEKEVRLELCKQELDRQKHVLVEGRKKLAAKERELENREQALVDADLLNMASGFTSSTAVESRVTEGSQPNGGTTAEFSDDDDDDFSGFGATSVSLPFSLDRAKSDDDSDLKEMPEVCSLLPSFVYSFTSHRLCYSFSALTLLVGRQEGHPACKKNLVLVCYW